MADRGHSGGVLSECCANSGSRAKTWARGAPLPRPEAAGPLSSKPGASHQAVSAERGGTPHVPDGAGRLAELERGLLYLQLLHQGLQLCLPLLTVLHLQLQVLLRALLSQEPSGNVLAGPVGQAAAVSQGAAGSSGSRWSVMSTTRCVEGLRGPRCVFLHATPHDRQSGQTTPMKSWRDHRHET